MALLLQLVALLLIIAGAITFPLPIPIGLILLLLGTALLLSTSRYALRGLRRYRRTRPVFDARLRAIRLRMPGYIGRALRRSEPRRFQPPEL